MTPNMNNAMVMIRLAKLFKVYQKILNLGQLKHSDIQNFNVIQLYSIAV